MLTRDVLRLAGVATARDARRRGRAARRAAPHARLRPQRNQVRVPRRDRARRSSRRRAARARRPRRGAAASSRAGRARADRRPTSGFADRELLELVEEAHRVGVKVKIAPRTTELLLQRAEYIPGEGAAAVRAAPAGARRLGVGGEARLRPRRVELRDRRRVCRSGLAIALRDQADVAGPGLLPRPAHRARRAARSG